MGDADIHDQTVLVGNGDMFRVKRAFGFFGVPAAVLVAATGVLISGGHAAVADTELQTSLVEDFEYPGAEEILEEHGLRVFTGDGHIELAGTASGRTRCAVGLVEVDALVGEAQEQRYFCFRMSGTRGFLTMELRGAFGVRGGDRPVEATAVLPDGDEKVYDVPVNLTVPIDPGAAGDDGPIENVLVELRFGQW